MIIYIIFVIKIDHFIYHYSSNKYRIIEKFSICISNFSNVIQLYIPKHIKLLRSITIESKNSLVSYNITIDLFVSIYFIDM